MRGILEWESRVNFSIRVARWHFDTVWCVNIDSVNLGILPNKTWIDAICLQQQTFNCVGMGGSMRHFASLNRYWTFSLLTDHFTTYRTFGHGKMPWSSTVHYSIIQLWQATFFLTGHLFPYWRSTMFCFFPPDSLTTCVRSDGCWPPPSPPPRPRSRPRPPWGAPPRRWTPWRCPASAAPGCRPGSRSGPAWGAGRKREKLWEKMTVFFFLESYEIWQK